jgi:hypothetical protein
MAAPHVSGIVALLQSAGITETTEIKNLLINTADDLGIPGIDPEYGAGLVNINRALGINQQQNSPDNSETEANSISLNPEQIMIFTVKPDHQNQFPEPTSNITYPDQNGNYNLSIAPGTWKVIVWFDYNNNQKIDAKDYWGESNLISITAGEIKTENINLNPISYY